MTRGDLGRQRRLGRNVSLCRQGLEVKVRRQLGPHQIVDVMCTVAGVGANHNTYPTVRCLGPLGDVEQADVAGSKSSVWDRHLRL